MDVYSQQTDRHMGCAAVTLSSIAGLLTGAASTTLIGGGASPRLSQATVHCPILQSNRRSVSGKRFRPNGARLCVSIAMQFEAGGQPISSTGGPITEPIEPGYPDLGTNSFFDYGIHEGMPRMLDLVRQALDQGHLVHDRRGDRKISRARPRYRPPQPAMNPPRTASVGSLNTRFRRKKSAPGSRAAWTASSMSPASGRRATTATGCAAA